MKKANNPLNEIRETLEKLTKEVRDKGSEMYLLQKENEQLKYQNHQLLKKIEALENKNEKLNNKKAELELEKKLEKDDRLKLGTATKNDYMSFVNNDKELFEILQLSIDVAIENGVSSSIINRKRLAQKLYLNIVGDKNHKPSITKERMKLFLDMMHKIGPDKLQHTEYMPHVRSADCLFDETERFIRQLKSTGLIKAKTQMQPKVKLDA